MTEYIDRNAAIVIADYAADAHPYDKDPNNPDTFSDYNRGWNDACDYIRDKLENEHTADVKPVRHGRWLWTRLGYACGEYEYKCSACGETEWRTDCGRLKFCPFCGAKMDLREQDGQ